MKTFPNFNPDVGTQLEYADRVGLVFGDAATLRPHLIIGLMMIMMMTMNIETMMMMIWNFAII